MSGEASLPLPEVLDAEPRDLRRRMIRASAAVLGLIAALVFADMAAGRWLGASVAADARLAALVMEQAGLARAAMAEGAGHATEADLAAAAGRLVAGDEAQVIGPAAGHLADILGAASAGADGLPGLVLALDAEAERLLARAASTAALAEKIAVISGFATLFAICAGGAIVWRPMIGLIVSRMRRLIAAHDAVQHAAFHDPLTGLPNRDSLSLQLDLLLSDPGLTGQLVAVVEVDLARLAAEAGDRPRQVLEEAIRRSAARLAEMRGPDDIVARLEGTTFAAVFADLLDDSELEPIGERVRKVLSAPMRIGMAEVCPGATVGVAGATAGRMLSGQALAASGQALARARGAGIGAVEVMGSTEVLARRAQDEAAAVMAGAPDSLSQRGLDQVMPSYRAVVVPGSGRVAALVLWSPAATNPGEGNARGNAPSRPLASDEGVAAERRAAALDRFGAMAQAGHGPSALLIPMPAAALVHPDAADRLLFDIENAGVAAEDVSLLLDARELCATRDLDLLASLRRLAGVGLTVSLDVPGRLDALPLLGFSDFVPAFVRLSASSFCRPGPIDPGGAALALARHFGAQPILHGEVDAELATRARRERILIEDPCRPIEASEIASHLARVGCADRAPWGGPARAPARWRRHA